MILVIGGYAQGKLAYVQQKLAKADAGVLDREQAVGDGAETEPKKENDLEKGAGAGKGGGQVIVNHLHLWVRELLQNGEDAEERILAFVREHPDSILICDEIGNGIVPMEAFEREYRERTGRLLIRLAQEAERVERVVCGIGQRIK